MAIIPSQTLIQAIRRYKAGQQEAFGDIYNGSVQYITRCVLNVLNRTAPDADPDLQQDIIQDTYMTIATKLDTLQQEEAFLQWAGQIATNHALRTYQRTARQHELEQPEDDLVYELPDERFIPEDILESKEKQQLIRSMLQQLPTGQYLCLVEYFYNGLNQIQVAEKLGMPLGTVKTNLSRAKKKLKEIVQTHEKKSGVKLYSMAWLLLALLCKDAAALALDPTVTSTTGKTLTQKLARHARPRGAGGAAAKGAAKAGMSLGAKIGAGILALAVAVTGATVAIVHHRQKAPEFSPAPIFHPDEVIPTVRYDGHYYFIVGPFDSWEQVLEYQESYGGSPASITSAEENFLMQNLFVTRLVTVAEDGQEVPVDVWDPVYTGLYLDQEEQWQWHNGEEVDYTAWSDSDPEMGASGDHWGAYYQGPQDLDWSAGSFPLAEENTLSWVLWEYDADSTHTERRGPLENEADPEEPFEFFIVDTTPGFLEEPEPEPAPMPEPAPETEPETEPEDLPITLTAEAQARMEQLLLYVAYSDSGEIDKLVHASWGAWVDDVQLEEDPFLRLERPVPTPYDQMDVLLLMGWNANPALEPAHIEDSSCGDMLGSYAYSVEAAEAAMTGLFGTFDSSYLGGNVFLNGYNTHISNGYVCQPFTHLYSENYGTLTVDHIENLGDGQVRIYATYERDFVLSCVYDAFENPASPIGYTLTGVSYTFAQ